MSAKAHVGVEGRWLALSNLDKVLYPAFGFTKAAVIDDYIPYGENTRRTRPSAHRQISLHMMDL